MGRLLLAIAAALMLAAPAAAAPVDEVDPFVGTAPPGFVFPGAVVPFGMVQNSPDTEGEFAYSGYLSTDPTIRGFSLVHLSGPGVRKAGDLPFMPTPDPALYNATFSKASEEATPGYYAVTLGTGIEVELTASTRAAMQRYTFPPVGPRHVVVDVTRSVEGTHAGAFEQRGTHEIAGWTRGRYPVHFVARFDQPITGKTAKSLTFAAQTVTMRVGISFVDEAGARRNLDAEAPQTRTFEQMRADAREAWAKQLDRVKIDGGNAIERKGFYTALYHSLLHPNVFEDVDGRYLGADGKPHVADGRTHYANFSSWDTYKAQNQLLALVEPGRYRDMMRSLIATYRESGKLPRWGEQNIDAAHMSGDPIIPMIADAECRGLLSTGERAQLYEGAKDLVARRPAELAQLGYLPMKPGTTLEYGGADFALALLARRAGDDAGAAKALKRSLNYRNILDANGWIHPRNADGSWYEPFSTTDETGFQEGNSWQYTWLAPHDARGLYDRMGGDGEAARRLDHLFRNPGEVGNRLTFFGVVYRFDMHAPGNEHDMQVPWMYAFAGQPRGVQRELADIRTLFRPTLDGLPGNDDLGSLSAFHVFSSLGFGPVTPGAPFHIVGSPAFPKATVDPAGSRPAFTVEAPGAGLTAPYVQSAKLNGKPLDRAWFFERDLAARGGTLELAMGGEPNTDWATDESDRPPSASDTKLNRFGC